MKNILCILCLCLCEVSPVVASDQDFSTNADAMVEKLTAQPQTLVMPKIRLRGQRPVPPIQLRSVKRMVQSTTGELKPEDIQIPLQQTNSHVNLKVEFDVNSASIRSNSFPILAELSKALSNPKLSGHSFFINGHTDSDGTKLYNLQLSFERANAVKLFLVTEVGIAANRLTVAGYGEGLPLVRNNSTINKQINRRVEVEIALE